MPVFLGYDTQTVGTTLSGEVGTGGTDLVQEEEEGSAGASEEPPRDPQRDENRRRERKESGDEEVFRKPSLVDIFSISSRASSTGEEFGGDGEEVGGDREREQERAVGEDSRPGKRGEGWESEEHVYCTVYCVARDYRRYSEGDLPDRDPEQDPDPEPEPDPEPYTLSDLTDPAVPSSEAVLQTCRICLEERPSRPLHCCLKAVCEECLKTYITSQVPQKPSLSVSNKIIIQIYNTITILTPTLSLILQIQISSIIIMIITPTHSNTTNINHHHHYTNTLSNNTNTDIIIITTPPTLALIV